MPFTSLGQSPEGCSSFTFPRMMGAPRANQMLMFNKKVTAMQAAELGLVTAVIPDDRFQTEVWPMVRAMAQLPLQSLVHTKVLAILGL